MTITGVVGLIISYALSMYVGALGACIGTAVTALANIIYMNTVYKRKAGINVFEFYKKCYLKALPCYIIVAIIGLFTISFITVSGWLGLLIKAAIVTVVYLLVFALIYFNASDRKAVLSRVLKKK